MTTAYGAIRKPRPASPLPLPLSVVLKDGSTAIVDRLDRSDTVTIEAARALLNSEIEGGRSYPQDEIMDQDAFANYFLAGDAFTVRATGHGRLLGVFYIKPNFPGRCSHICNAGFIVAADARGLSVGKHMAKAFLQLAPKLGYRASMFNLVFETNIASVQLWKSLGFQQIGRVPNAGRLRREDGSGEEYVDAFIVYCDFDSISQ